MIDVTVDKAKLRKFGKQTSGLSQSDLLTLAGVALAESIRGDHGGHGLRIWRECHAAVFRASMAYIMFGSDAAEYDEQFEACHVVRIHEAADGEIISTITKGAKRRLHDPLVRLSQL